MVMLPQRVRAAESRMKYRPSNGPRRVQSNVGCAYKARRARNPAEYSATWGHTSVAGDMKVSC